MLIDRGRYSFLHGTVKLSGHLLCFGLVLGCDDQTLLRGLLTLRRYLLALLCLELLLGLLILVQRLRRLRPLIVDGLLHLQELGSLLWRNSRELLRRHGPNLVHARGRPVRSLNGLTSSSRRPLWRLIGIWYLDHIIASTRTLLALHWRP